MGNFDFNKEVLERSYQRPVLVDFWAPWCGPCRVLGPVIEQLAAEQSDRWDLVKVNTEEEYALAERYRIQGIPNVKLFYKGEVIAEFSGALPKTAIERWLNEYLPDERKSTLAALLAQADAAGNGQAVERLATFAEQNPDLREATLAAAGRLVFSDPQRAMQLVADVHLGDKFYHAAEDIRQLAQLLAFEGNDHPAAEKLLQARHALENHQIEEAIQRLIEATLLDKQYHDEMPRKASIALFRTLGERHPLTRQYRRRFDMALY